jgi:hypothetical protein
MADVIDIKDPNRHKLAGKIEELKKRFDDGEVSGLVVLMMTTDSETPFEGHLWNVSVMEGVYLCELAKVKFMEEG